MGGGGTEEEAMEGQIEASGKIFVSVRVRPLNDKEARRNDVVDWECVDNNTIIYKNKYGPDRSMYPSSYSFDRVFGPNCTTRQVYQEGAKAIALSAVSGINVSVFAYGQTSSGKTYTMTGVTEYAMVDIFEYIQKHNEREFVLKFSAMEIYNEAVRDLLSLDSTPLRLLDDPERGTVVEKLTEEVVRSWEHLQQLLFVCKAQRQIGETLLNESSSRSHQIIRLAIESYARDPSADDDGLSALHATVSFIDLAGSERASQSLTASSRMKEGSHINRSLLTLGTVIRKLSKERNGHIPYRDSKLTRILQSSLGGNARTAIICTMSPARSYVEQSRNTLHFAMSAKQVTASAKVNLQVSDKALVKHLQRELARVENELQNAGSSAVDSDSVSRLREKDVLIEKLERQVRELTLQRDLALSHIQDVQLDGDDDRRPLVRDTEDPFYPKLYVRRQSSPIPSSYASSVPDLHYDSFSMTQESSFCSSPRSWTVCDDSQIFSDFEDDFDFLPKIATHPAPFELSDDASPTLFIRAPVSEKTELDEVSYNCIGPTDEVAEECCIKAPLLYHEEPDASDVETSPTHPGHEREEICSNASFHSSSWDGNGDKSFGMVKSRSCGADMLSGSLSLQPEVEEEETYERSDTGHEKEITVLSEDNVLERTENSIKNVKDAGLQYDLDGAEWPSNFRRLQAEVIDLWEVCNVSLMYRTSFFLLFQGDPADAIYMEVEHRRLSFMKGNGTVLDGHIIPPSLSKKQLQQERHMLSKLLKSRISKHERESLYDEWGIDLKSKNRSSQLAKQLWTKTDDMDHIEGSAGVVAKLIRFDKRQTRKEMFGLNLAPALKGGGSYSWRYNATSLF